MAKVPLDSVAGLHVLVTGAAQGMGFIFAKQACLEGAARVILWDINELRLEKALAELRLLEANVEVQAVDLADPAQIQRYAQSAVDSGGVDVLVNNAGIITGTSFDQHQASEITATMQVNALAPMHLTHALLPQLRRSGHGRVLTMASAAALVSNPNMSVYAASKAATLSWSDSLRLELEADDSIAVSTICPTYISTGMFAGARPMLFTPIMEPQRVVDRAWRAMLAGQPLVLMPWTSKLGQLLRGVLPRPAWDFVAGKIIGVYHLMDGFTGRANGEEPSGEVGLKVH
ncbi:SDR family NAD(P)-dependent oxidoreductase [Glutamicibacter sp. JL.03c]|uniref:SDR family NAD(P)-dependent oxidoreductase n=1 Tax=Glutamicibacter sp. JL.03c TaxID=2984842 RepID=UPI0021F6EB86|nr:SDR family NAD(P)-dependent oxidoreductase [Glutamicibacter sp. JL.03c]UYQ76138.1 SDR family NAD(P)-dependent oxidoreductase [Glutamicibacter sp. JL.03c]